MSFYPITNIASNYRDYGGWWIKAYKGGTTTPIAIYTDADGGGAAAKLQINSDGFIVSAGGLIVNPFVEESYSLYMFPTAAEADSNDTGEALRLADDVSVFSEESVEVDSVESMKNYEASNGTSIKTKGYYSPGDGGGALYLIAGTNEDGRGLTLDNGKFAILQTSGLIDLRQLGASDGQDVTPILSLEDVIGGGNYEFTSGETPLSIDSISFANQISLYCYGTRPHFSVSSPDADVFYFGAENSKIIGAIFDYSATASLKYWTPVNLAAKYCKAKIKVLNLKSPLDNEDTAVSGCKMTSQFCDVDIEGVNLTNTGSSNGSLPHLIDIQGGASNNVVSRVTCDVGVSGVILAESSSNHIYHATLDGLTDNGLYVLDNAESVTVDYLYYKGDEEPVVDKGSNTKIDNLVIENQISPIGIDDNQTPLEINSLTIIASDVSLLKSNPSAIVQSRNSNTSSAGVKINKLSGVCYGSRMFGFTNGEVKSVKIRNLDATFVYHDAGQTLNILGHSDGEEVSYRDWQLVINDETGTLTASSHFTMSVPTNITKPSYWDNVKVQCPDGDYDFRGLNCLNDLITIIDAQLETSGSNAYIVEGENFEIGFKRLFVTSLPSAGSYKRGTQLWRINANASQSQGWIAVADIPDASASVADFKEMPALGA